MDATKLSFEGRGGYVRGLKQLFWECKTLLLNSNFIDDEISGGA